MNEKNVAAAAASSSEGHISRRDGLKLTLEQDKEGFRISRSLTASTELAPGWLMVIAGPALKSEFGTRVP
jgi:hypothetical protein